MADNNDNKLFFGGKAADDFVECHEHISPVSLYLKVLAALFVLTGLTYAVSYANLGPASLPVAMIVAAMKATLVSAFFMHLIYDDKFHVFIFASSLLFVAIFFTFTIFDLESRDRLSEAQATDFRRADGGWDDMGRMGAANNTEASRPACSDGTVPMCDQTFAVCNGEDAHGGEDYLVRRIENECFVSQMVPSVDHDGKPQVDKDGVPVMVDAGCVLPKLGCVNPHTAEGHKAAAPKPAAGADAKVEGKPDAKPDAKPGAKAAPQPAH